MSIILSVSRGTGFAISTPAYTQTRMKQQIQHICLADDDHDDYLLFSTVLEEIDNSIQLNYFNAPEELLSYLHTTISLPDLIVLDMNMPRRNGQQCLEVIKNNDRLQPIPVVMFSTAFAPDAIELAHKTGAVKCLKKPDTISKLKEIIFDLLEPVRA